MSETDRKVREIVMAAAADALNAYQQSYLDRRCESEIERLMMASFFAEHLNFFTYPRFFVIFHPTYDNKGLDGILAHSRELMEFGKLDCVVWPQAPIGPYRVDFLCVGEVPLIVECDGHDFHERTKKQAARDKSRDRFFVACNLPTMRFTGSEIWKDARACISEIGSYFRDIECRRSAA